MPYESFLKTEIDGAFLIQPKIFGDDRGWYCPEFEKSEFEDNTKTRFDFIQLASSFNQSKGILRGLHYQTNKPQGKLVQVISGSVLDVGVDIRQKSPTFGKTIAVILTAQKHNQLWLPPGIAHGYIALEENTRFNYLVTSSPYNPQSEKGLNPFDPKLSIDWIIPRNQIQINQRDQSFPKFSDIPPEDLL